MLYEYYNIKSLYFIEFIKIFKIFKEILTKVGNTLQFRVVNIIEGGVVFISQRLLEYTKNQLKL